MLLAWLKKEPKEPATLSPKTPTAPTLAKAAVDKNTGPKQEKVAVKSRNDDEKEHTCYLTSTRSAWIQPMQFMCSAKHLNCLKAAQPSR